MPSRIPPALARRIDRLARSAHAFHRFAHHPLCDEYRGELVALGRRARVCKGCLCALAGGAAGAVAGLIPAHVPGAALLVLAAMLAFATILWTRARAADEVRSGAGSAVAHEEKSPAARAKDGATGSKLATRFVPLAMAGFIAVAGVREGTTGLAAALVAIGAMIYALALYRAHGPRRAHCAVCPERLRPAPCRGYRAIWRREKAFTRRASQLLQAAARAPARH